MNAHITSHILMVRPSHLDYNPYTVESNAFQEKAALEVSFEVKQERALEEFDKMVELLQAVGIEVSVIEDTPQPKKSDAVFPNNWISFHEDAQVILYPMFAPNRRTERRQDILDQLSQRFHIKEVIDFSHFEEKNQFLESTGSMILDRPHKIAYACYSGRTHDAVLDEFEKKMDYRSHRFKAQDDQGRAIYHTNVMMHVGSSLAVICLEAIPDISEKNKISHTLIETGKEILEISMEQMKEFAGNMLEVANIKGERFTIMSARAYNSLKSSQIRKIEKYSQIIAPPLETIEQNGGGSARCMIAEIFLPLLPK